MDARQILAWNLRALRVERRLSQERLALASATDRSYVGRVERGSENVTLDRIEAFARALEVPVSQLFVEPERSDAQLPRLRAGRKVAAER